MIIINTPGNPTGSVYTENELAGLADVALDEEQTKRAFWTAFRALGRWYAELPPY